MSVKSSVICEFQQLLSTEKNKVYKVSTQCAHLIGANIKKTLELKLDVCKVLLAIIDCEKVVKPELNKEVT